MWEQKGVTLKISPVNYTSMSDVIEAPAKSSSRLKIYGIEVVYDPDVIFGCPTNEGVADLGDMELHMKLIRRQTGSPEEMAGIINEKLKRYQAALDSGILTEPDAEKVQNTVGVYSDFVAKVMGGKQLD